MLSFSEAVGSYAENRKIITIRKVFQVLSVDETPPPSQNNKGYFCYIQYALSSKKSYASENMHKWHILPPASIKLPQPVEEVLEKIIPSNLTDVQSCHCDIFVLIPESCGDSNAKFRSFMERIQCFWAGESFLVTR